MLKKHFICTHTFHSDETRKKYFEQSKGVSVKDWFANTKNEKVKCLQTWLGDEDFWFCHWEAESEDDLHEFLEESASNDLIVTLAQEMKYFASLYHGDQNTLMYDE